MKFELPIQEIIQETHDVKTFRFVRPKELVFKPGDHAKVSLPGKPEARPFTFSSAPNSEFLDLTIKLHGTFTEQLFELTIWDIVIIEGPIGEGLEFESFPEPLLLIGAGSGITPLASLIRHIQKENLSNEVVFLDANKTSKDIIFKDELNSLPDNFKVIHVLSREESENSGHVNEDMINKNVKDPEKYRWFICGPPAFTKSIIEIARNYVSDEKIMAETWYK